MYSLSEKPIETVHHYIGNSADFIREFDDFTLQIETQVGGLQSALSDGRLHYLRSFSRNKLENKGISDVLAELSEVSNDAQYRKALLSIQQDLNSIILEYSSLRRLCFHLAPVNIGIRQIDNIERFAAKLAGKVHQNSRKITDQLEVATKRVLDADSTLFTGKTILSLQLRVDEFSSIEVESAHARIIKDSLKHSLQEFVSSLKDSLPEHVEESYREQPKLKEQAAGISAEEFESRQSLVSKRIDTLEYELAELRSRGRVQVDDAEDRLTKKIDALAENLISEKRNNQKLFQKIEELEQRIDTSDRNYKRVNEVEENVREINLRTKLIEDEIAYINKKTEKQLSRFELDIDEMRQTESTSSITGQQKDISRIEEELGRVRNRLDRLDEHQLSVARLLAEKLSSRNEESHRKQDDVIMDLFRNIDKRLRLLLGK